MSKNIKVEEIFGSRVFDRGEMKARLSKETYKKLEKIMDSGAELSLDIADEVAAAMKDWAIEKGATHFTHWFQPLTGFTAEKHVAFIDSPSERGKVVYEFSGKELVRGELDASSFPNGGLRATFEARGYTTWDCTSPAFIKEDAIGKILCIPTAFCSYSGAALDLKTPLLRSMQAVNAASLRLLHALGFYSSKRVTPMAGAEQEYFLISKDKFLKRKDLVYTGRTLFGTMPAKDQDSAAHYSGAINERVGAFMKAVNLELWRYGVPAKIQHNEVAPSQHEICPVFLSANISTDHNQLIMEILKKVADRNNLACILHEKPFDGINGSGKHNNWSLITDDGINLLSPGETERDRLRFLLILSCLIKAVDRHAGLVRLSASCVGNDYRLGGNEAPPSVISIFIGEKLEKELLAAAENSISAEEDEENTRISTGVSFLSSFDKDSSDRNRTSPFAFVGNRFEFRMVGSSDSIASANTVLNSISAQSFSEAAEIIENAENKEAAVYRIIHDNIAQHGRIVFNGNGYSEEWRAEAERRGLKNISGAAAAIEYIVAPESIRLFEEIGVLSEEELRARCEIRYESFVRQLHIEALSMINIAQKQLIPAIVKYTRDMALSISAVKKACSGADTSVQENALTYISSLLREAGNALAALEKAISRADGISDVREKAFFFKDSVRPLMQELRAPLDIIEKHMDKKSWPLPSYGDLLFDV
ncbi:MAG: glutamine synthetase III [Lachnospiraceae bacterium]|nr:glutamine synthetase III [Lachnospiraceae bacterium]